MSRLGIVVVVAKASVIDRVENHYIGESCCRREAAWISGSSKASRR